MSFPSGTKVRPDASLQQPLVAEPDQDQISRRPSWQENLKKAFQKQLTNLNSFVFSDEVKIVVVPMFFCCFGMWYQLALEHYATYVYVHRYAKNDEDAANSKYITLYDPVQEAFFPYKAWDLKTIDKSAYAPALLFLGMAIAMYHLAKRVCKDKNKSWFLQRNILTVWAKVLSMWSLLAIMKGTFDAATVMPDSSGWDVCKARLQGSPPDDWGIDFMRDNQPFYKFLILDFMYIIWTGGTHTPPMRLCCDMMLSGHTFTVVIFALGAYELIRIFASDSFLGCVFPRWDCGRSGNNILTPGNISIGLLIILVLLQQSVEIYAVEQSHFHYSVDIAVALIMSFLVWTNSLIPFAAKKWATNGILFGPGGIFVLGGCGPCLPFLCCKKEDMQAQLEGVKEKSKISADVEFLDSSGDVLVPVCLWPCCCACFTKSEEGGFCGLPFGCSFDSCSLREHVYTDLQVRHLIARIVQKHLPKQELPMYWRRFYPQQDGVDPKSVDDIQRFEDIMDQFRNKMNMTEGLTFEQLTNAIPGYSKDAFQLESDTGLDPNLRIHIRASNYGWEDGWIDVYNRRGEKVKYDEEKDELLGIKSDDYPLKAFLVGDEAKAIKKRESSIEYVNSKRKEWLKNLREDCDAKSRWWFLKLIAVQIVIPGIVACIAFRFVTFCWALGTYNYVQHYGSLGSKDKGRDRTILTDPLSAAISVRDSTVNVNSIEFIPGKFQEGLLFCLFVVTFLVLFVKKDTRSAALQVWIKVFAVGCYMLPLTAVFSLFTSIPDAAGWEACKERLHEEDWNFMVSKEGHSFLEILSFGLSKSLSHSTSEIRGTVCGVSFSDYLGVSITLCLGFFELALFMFRHLPIWRARLVFVIIVLSFINVGWCIATYEHYNMHYSMDWLMNIILAFLFYTNGALTIAATNYSRLCREAPDDSLVRKDSSPTPLTPAMQADIEAFVSAGDILIPPCCPASGRYHIFHDEKVKYLMEEIFNLPEKQREELMVRMNMNEGVNFKGMTLQSMATTVVEEILAPVQDQMAMRSSAAPRTPSQDPGASPPSLQPQLSVVKEN